MLVMLMAMRRCKCEGFHVLREILSLNISYLSRFFGFLGFQSAFPGSAFFFRHGRWEYHIIPGFSGLCVGIILGDLFHCLPWVLM